MCLNIYLIVLKSWGKNNMVNNELLEKRRGKIQE